MPTVEEIAELVFREEYGRIVATMIRVLNDFDLAEEAVQDAFTVALHAWRRDGIPNNPAAWLVTAAKHRAIDGVRREHRRAEKYEALAEPERLVQEAFDMKDESDSTLEDDRLRLMFTCCHPALNMEAQVALTLRTLGGLTTPKSLGFIRPQKVSKIADVLHPVDQLRVKHRGYDISGPEADMNCVFPLQRLLEMEAEGKIGELAPTAYSFMGLISANTNALMEETAPEVARRLKQAGVDAAFITAT
ncbi:MAG: glycine/sarcosine/betaine reductase selenoprotein B family protein [Chloroflexi bacterium]|nr:glycine/sarcosine/betaine reductase selenoprotein B family protein [Chloroflexota bacterium]